MYISAESRSLEDSSPRKTHPLSTSGKIHIAGFSVAECIGSSCCFWLTNAINSLRTGPPLQLPPNYIRFTDLAKWLRPTRDGIEQVHYVYSQTPESVMHPTTTFIVTGIVKIYAVPWCCRILWSYPWKLIQIAKTGVWEQNNKGSVKGPYILANVLLMCYWRSLAFSNGHQPMQ